MHERTVSSNATDGHGRLRRALATSAIWLAATAALPHQAHQSASSASDGDSRTNIRQIEAGARSATLPADVDARQPTTSRIDQLGDGRSRDAVPQVMHGGEAPPPLTQVGARDRAAAAGPQLSTGAPSAQAAAPLSTREQSRPPSVVRLQGADKCDPASANAASAECARVIEARSAEYRSASPPVLSPEQRLLIGQQQREAIGDPATVARRLGRSDVDADARDAQGIASLVLPGGPAETVPTQPEDSLEGLSDGTIGLIQAIVQNAQGGAPQ